MNYQNLFNSLSGFCQLCEKLEVNPVVVLEHFSFSNNLKTGLRSTDFLFSIPGGSIGYAGGDRITGKEEVIRTEIIANAPCNFISNLCFWVSTLDLILILDNKRSINDFSKEGDREEDVLKEWPLSHSLPNRIYFVKKNTYASYIHVDVLYKEVLNEVELNVLASFNTKYPEFHKICKNAIQRQYSGEKFYYAIFHELINGPNVSVASVGTVWDDEWWFAGQLIK